MLLLILQGMYHWEREHVEQGNHPMPCVILLNQAHRFLPYRDAYSVANADPSLARLLSGNLLHYLAMHGEFGMYFYLVTDQATRMNPAALQELGLWLIKQPQLDELPLLLTHSEEVGVVAEPPTGAFEGFFLFLIHRDGSPPSLTPVCVCRMH